MEQQRISERHDGAAKEIAPGVAYMRDRIVNVFFLGTPEAGDEGWVLVDAGLRGAAGRIERAAAARFGSGARPAAIVLTHGHFDHVGALRTLAERWDVPVYAHELEMPYITGRSSYPPPDPTVGGGAMARLAGLYPRGPIDLGARALTLPADGSIPAMPGWRWIHTPGHTAGHVSLFRDADRTLIAGDAFVTTKQESLTAAITQRAEVHGPPAYYTPDWDAARESVQRLSALAPEVAGTGHGTPMRGSRLRSELERLAQGFDAIARPRHGRYVHEPAVADASGVVYLPPPVPDPMPKVLAGVAAVVVAGAAVRAMRGRNL
ncbi:MAG TPA: MBL fold metallo-hydrolase [Gemmatimonadaceae bacterium]|nr:MBL fold metallo-hydrolase [Gemmatimonadaceae bacterium]